MYQVMLLETGPKLTKFMAGFETKPKAYARLVDYFQQNGYEILDQYDDIENDAMDIMAAKHGVLYQYAIELDR